MSPQEKYIFELFEDIIKLKNNNILNYVKNYMSKEEQEKHLDNIFNHLLSESDIAFLKLQLLKRNMTKKRFFRFSFIDKKILEDIVLLLNQLGFQEVPNSTDGDEDYIIIDTVNNEYIWCEYGFSPFCSDGEMEKYNNSDETLSSLDKMRYWYP